MVELVTWTSERRWVVRSAAYAAAQRAALEASVWPKQRQRCRTCQRHGRGRSVCRKRNCTPPQRPSSRRAE